MMTSSILDADVKELCIHVMKKVIEKTQKYENESISKNAVYEKACATSNGIGAFDSSNITLKNRVFQELFTRGHIKQGNNPDEIKITDIGKNYPEYLNT
jgi:hypothetical protein